MYVYYFFFFFQAEDGIRDLTVTGVQTCALPICPSHRYEKARALLGDGKFAEAAGAFREVENASARTHPLQEWATLDRKSTRLNSSHSQISYAVFCLKKKRPPTIRELPNARGHRR